MAQLAEVMVTMVMNNADLWPEGAHHTAERPAPTGKCEDGALTREHSCIGGCGGVAYACTGGDEVKGIALPL